MKRQRIARRYCIRERHNLGATPARKARDWEVFWAKKEREADIFWREQAGRDCIRGYMRFAALKLIY